MDSKQLETILREQLQENHRLLQENNFLLHKIVQQNQLVFEITQENIRYYSYYHYWGEGDKVKKLKKELKDLHYRTR